jgi:hypothetical protein
MKTLKLRSKLSFLITLCSLLMLGSCNQMSEQIKDESAGMNGGFEVTKNGIPVNWLMYTPNTVPNGKFKIILDKEEFKEGKQSLKFEVEECSSNGGWGSPGFTNQFNAEQGNTYKLSFWIKNDGAEFRVMAGGVAPKTGDMKTLLQTSDQTNDWKQYVYVVPVTEEFDQIRLEVNILKPGTFWIDDIQIEKE